MPCSCHATKEGGKNQISQQKKKKKNLISNAWKLKSFSVIPKESSGSMAIEKDQF